MAGYNRSGPNFGNPEKFTNATSYNSQIIEQRNDYKARATNADQEDYGVASDTSLLFAGFEADKIIAAASEQFLVKKVNAGDNPDFTTDFNADEFKSFSEIKRDAIQFSRSDAPDGPRIGVGPTLATQNIDDATRGTLTNNFVGTNNIRKRGFGWRSDDHSSTTIGSYLGEKYKFNATDTTAVQVIQGENIDTNVIDYSQP